MVGAKKCLRLLGEYRVILTLLFNFQPDTTRIGQGQLIVFNRQCSVGISDIDQILCPTIDFGRANDQFRQPIDENFMSVPTKPDLYAVRNSRSFLPHLQPVNLWVCRVQTSPTTDASSPINQ